MSYNNKLEIVQIKDESLLNVVNGLKFVLKGLFKEVVEEVKNETNYQANIEDQRLTSEQLCARWSISKGTLHNWEVDGKIKPLNLGGRRKIYSLKDVIAAECEGLIKNVF